MTDRPFASRLARALPAVLSLVTLAGCPGPGGGAPAGEVPGSAAAGASAAPASAAEYRPAFPPDLPFDPGEWQTAGDYPPIGDPRAVRGTDETLLLRWESFPPTLRTQGPNSRLVQTSMLHDLMFEPMVQIHPETEEFIPRLASHWKVELDEAKGVQTFTFRLDPRARWADGSPVTADDVAATFWHRVQEDRQDPSSVLTYREGFHDPEVLDRLTIRVRTKELNWRLFLYFGGMPVYPAKEIRVPGARYLEEYNWKFPMGSGPYLMRPEDLKKGESLTLTRRADWWADGERWAKGTYNFPKIKCIVVSDENLEYEMLKKGDLQIFTVTRAQQWVEKVPKEEVVQKGWVKMRKIYNQSPQGFGGLVFNMREKPFDDRRVRLAFCHLFNRERLMEKLFFNEYEYMNSYEPGRDWGNGKENPQVRYDPEYAQDLLAQAGYERRDADGFLVGPDGKRLQVTLEMRSPTLERIFLVVKEDFEKAGVKFDLKLIDASTSIKKVGERQFQIHFQTWSGLLFPNPETSWRSELADKKNNNNLPGFKNARVDELMKRYNVTFDRAEQKRIMREIDRLIYEEHPYALGWYANYSRILYWDRFGHPPTYFTRIGQTPEEEIVLLWWPDAERAKTLSEAMKAGARLPQGEVVVKPWAHR